MSTAFGPRVPVSVLKGIGVELLQDETGQDLIEYALVACLIALAAVASVKPIAGKVSNLFNAESSNVTNAI